MEEPCIDPFSDLENCLDEQATDTTLDSEYDFLKIILKGTKFTPDNVFGVGFVNRDSFPNMAALYLTRKTYQELEKSHETIVKFDRIRTKAIHEFSLDENVPDLNNKVMHSYHSFPRYITLRKEPLSVLVLYVSAKK